MSGLLLIHNILVRLFKLHQSKRGLATRFKRKMLRFIAAGVLKLVPDPKKSGGRVWSYTLYHMLFIQPLVALLTVFNMYILLYLSVAAEVRDLSLLMAWDHH